jgi:hypothetical protein
VRSKKKGFTGVAFMFGMTVKDMTVLTVTVITVKTNRLHGDRAAA